MNVAVGYFVPVSDSIWKGPVAMVGSSSYVIDSVAVGDVLFDENGKKFVVLADSVMTPNYSSSLTVRNLDGSGRPLSGRAALMRPTSVYGLNLPPQNGNNYISENTESKLLVDNFLALEEISATSMISNVYFSGDSMFLIFLGGDTISVYTGGPSFIVPDTTTINVYAPSHNLTDSIALYGYVPIKGDFTRANSSTIDSIHIAYAIGAPDPDTLTLKFSGVLLYGAYHGLPIGVQLYLQDDGTEDITVGTITVPTAYATDSTTIILSEVGALTWGSYRRISMPSPLITAFGGDPQVPTDSVVQAAIENVYVPAGLAQPGTYFTINYAGASKNPSYQETDPLHNPLTPSYAWFWDGAYATRLKNLIVSVDIRDTAYGVFANLRLTPIDSFTVLYPVPDTAIANWLETNYANGLRLSSGSVLYDVGAGTRQSPNKSWLIIDDLSNVDPETDWMKIFKSLGGSMYINNAEDVDTVDIAINDLLQWNGTAWIMSSPAEVISTIYNADDTITSNRTVEIGANTLAFVSNNAALDAIQFYQVNGSNWNNSSIGYQRLYWDVGDIDSEAYQTIYTTQIRNKVQTPDGYVDYRINDTTADYRLHNVSSDLYALFSPTGFSLSPTTYTTPTAMLDIAGDVRVRSLPSDVAPTGVVTADANGNFTSSTPAQIVSAGGGGYWSLNGADSLYTMYGKVGIGTSTPTNPLNIVASYVGSVLRAENTNSNGWASFTSVNDLGNTVSFGVGGSTSVTFSNTAYFNVISAIPFSIGTNNTQRLTINADGLIVFKPISANPTGTAGGQYYDSDNSTMWYHDGTAYRAIVKGDAGSWTAGSIPFSDGSKLVQDNSGLYFDASANELRINSSADAGNYGLQVWNKDIWLDEGLVLNNSGNINGSAVSRGSVSGMPYIFTNSSSDNGAVYAGGYPAIYAVRKGQTTDNAAIILAHEYGANGVVIGGVRPMLEISSRRTWTTSASNQNLMQLNSSLSIDWNYKVQSGVDLQKSARIEAMVLDTTGTESVSLDLSYLNEDVLTKGLRLYKDGITAYDYGSGTITGTPTYYSAWDATGKFIETTAADIVSAGGGLDGIPSLLPLGTVYVDALGNDLTLDNLGFITFETGDGDSFYLGGGIGNNLTSVNPLLIQSDTELVLETTGHMLVNSDSIYYIGYGTTPPTGTANYIAGWDSGNDQLIGLTPAEIVTTGGGGYWIKIGVDSIYTLDYVGIGTSELKYTGYVGDVKLRVSGSDSTVLGRTSFIVENNSVSNNSAAAFGLINNVGKGVFVQATSSTYPTPSIGAFYTSNNFDMGFFTDGGLTTGGTSKIYFKAGGYVDEDLTINPDGLVVFEPTSANPTGEAGGQYYDSDNSTMWYHDGTAYRAVVKGDAGSWTSGRIPYSNGSQLTSDADMTFDGYTATISGLKGYQYVSGHEGSVVGMFFNASNPKIQFNLHNGGNEGFAQFRSSTGSAWANIGKHSSTGGQGTNYGIALSSGAVGGTGTISTINGSENLVITTCYNANYSSGNITVVPGTAIHSTNAGSLFLVGGKQDAETTGSVAGLTGQVYIQTYFDHNQQDSATTRRTHMIFSGRNSRITTQLYHLYNYGTPSYVLVMHGDTIKQATPAEIVSAGGAPTGSGAANRVAYWNGTSTLTSNAGFTYDGTDLAVTTGDILVGASTPESVYNYLTGADQGVSSLYVENTGGVSDPIAYFNNPLGIARFNVNSGVGGNSGFGIACLDSIRWTIASYQGGTGKFDFTFYNSQIGEDAMFIDGDNNYITLGSSDTPAAALDIQMTSINLTRENGLRIQISDAGDDQFFIGNGSSTNGRFVPIFGGIVTSYSPAPSVGFRGFHTAAGDISGATAVSIGGMRTSSASNPNNGTWSNLVNARILNVYNYATTLFSVEADGGVTIHPLTGTTPTGSEGMLYADADDNNLYYHDGTAFRKLLTELAAGSGLTYASGAIKLGGTLTETTTIAGGYQIAISGDLASSAKLSIVNNGSSGVGVSSTTTSGNAYYGSSTNSYAAYLVSTNGNGAFIYSTNNTALYTGVNPSSTNTVVDVINVQRTSSGIAANGIGGAVAYPLQTSSGATVTAMRLKAVWEDATAATRTSNFVVSLQDSTVTYDALTLHGDRGILEVYGGVRDNLETEVSATATATLGHILPVDASGGAISISVPTYPAPQAGDWFAVSNSRASSNTITIDFTGASVNYHGSSADETLSSGEKFARFTYVDATVGWVRTN